MPNSDSNNRGPKKGGKTWLVLTVAIIIAGLLALWQFRAIVDPRDSRAPRRNLTPTDQKPPPKTAVPDKASPVKADQDSSSPTANWRLGLVTGTDHQSSEILQAVREAKKLYGDANSGGLIRHLTYPDTFLADLDVTIKTIESLADDPLVKVILVMEGVPGTAEAFKKIRAKRPEMILLIGESHENTTAVAQVADMVVNGDFISRGYLIPYGAKKLGAKTLVHVSFPRHMIDESLSRAKEIMELACEDLGLDFVYANSPDPTAQKGLKHAQDFILEKVPLWLKKYGPDTAFYTTNNAHATPMIKKIIENGGYFVEADESSPFLGYPEALGLNVSSMTNDWDQAVREIEAAILKEGAGGRLGSWASSLTITHILGMVEFGRLVATGQADRRDVLALLKCYEGVNPKVKWNGDFYADESLKKFDNVFLIYQDTYIFGLGFLGLTDVEVPLKYKTYKKS
ncbi:MAG: DUF3798 domain-containing protein [Deltaproteobacteria bacterium]|jgi:hypothetical protein|nr:DUF3798 domain-containing protein [Deltaproteobacteria bacterium]